jgi:hypothetical protein
MTWQCILSGVAVKGLKKCCISSAVSGTEDDMVWNDSKRTGMLGVSVRKMKRLTLKTDTVTLIGKDR